MALADNPALASCHFKASAGVLGSYGAQSLRRILFNFVTISKVSNEASSFPTFPHPVPKKMSNEKKLVISNMGHGVGNWALLA